MCIRDSVMPIETTSAYKLDRAYYNSSDYTSVDIGDFTFITATNDEWDSTDCNVIVENQSGAELFRTTSTKSALANVLTCSGTVDISSIVSTDGMYFVRVNVTDSDSDLVLSKRKVFYVCNDVNSSGDGWTCAKLDMDNDGHTEGLYSTTFSSLYGGTPLVCDSCPGMVNLNRDSDGDGIDDVCDVDINRTINVTLLTPLNDSVVSPGDIDFVYEVNGSTILECRLWTDISGAWNYTLDWESVSAGENNFSLTINTEGSYIWNIECRDWINNIGTGLNNYSFAVQAAAEPPAPPVGVGVGVGVGVVVGAGEGVGPGEFKGVNTI